MKPFYLLPMTIGTLLLCSCSSSLLQSSRDKYPDAFIEPKAAQQALQATTPCCNTFQELTYEPINKKEKLDIIIDTNSSVYPFDSGNSFVHAYQLTNHFPKIKITLTSEIFDSVIAPQITLLDSEFNITRTIRPEQFSYVPAHTLHGDQLITSLIINRPQPNNPANETYLLIYTTTQAMTTGTKVIHPAKAFAKAHNTVPPAIADPVIPHSAVGYIAMEIKSLSEKSEADGGYFPPIQSTAPAQPTKPDTTKKLAENRSVTPLAKEREQELNQAIIDAISANDINNALKLVEEAEALGSISARSTFVDALKAN